ncbi:MAG: hypothetical protein AAGF44_08185 [Pseudomonadota bacterium]
MRLFTVATVITLLAAPAGADEISDTLEAALEAYRAGDIALAKEELDYAGQLLSQLKAQGLTGFLPAPLDGWEKSEPSTQAAGAAMFGGGLLAEATYSNGASEIGLRLMADNPMVVAMGTAFGNAALMGAMGEVRRINRQKLIVTPEGDVQALINGRVMVQIEGDGSTEDKLSYFEALDIEGLKSF